MKIFLCRYDNRPDLPEDIAEFLGCVVDGVRPWEPGSNDDSFDFCCCSIVLIRNSMGLPFYRRGVSFESSKPFDSLLGWRLGAKTFF